MKNIMNHLKKVLAVITVIATLCVCSLTSFAYDFGAAEYAEKCACLTYTNDAGQKIYRNWFNDGSWAGHHQDGYKMMAVVEPCGTKGALYIDIGACDQKVFIDEVGLEDLKDIIKFEDGSYIKSIRIGDAYALEKVIYSYKITVCSSGVKSLSYVQHMSFQDESGDVYRLSMLKSGKHDLCYNSKQPKIYVITWGY